MGLKIPTVILLIVALMSKKKHPPATTPANMVRRNRGTEPIFNALIKTMIGISPVPKYPTIDKTTAAIYFIDPFAACANAFFI